MIKGVKFVSIPIHDQTRALAFYTDKLGCEVTTDAPMGPGMRWIDRSLGELLLFSRIRRATSSFYPLDEKAKINEIRFAIPESISS